VYCIWVYIVRVWLVYILWVFYIVREYSIFQADFFCDIFVFLLKILFIIITEFFLIITLVNLIVFIDIKKAFDTVDHNIIAY
jgi:hypothetical protein